MATASFTLPHLGRHAGAADPTASALRKRVLVVDDDPGVLSALARLLQALEVDVETAADPTRALALFESGEYDLVISDERMPKMSGLDMLRHVRAVSPRTPTILMTAYADPRAFERAYERCGVFRYLTKPWNASDLVTTVQDALRAADALA